MRRFKSGWALVAVALLAIGVAMACFSPDVWRRKLGDRDRGRHVEAERLSKRALSVKEKSFAAKQPETAAILEQIAPLPRDSGQAARVEGPNTRQQPIRIRTH